MTPAPLSPHVRHVLCLCAKKEVPRIDAQPVVASMKNAAAMRSTKVWNVPMVQFVADTVSCALEPVQRDQAIAGRSGSEKPRPAFIIATPIDVSPKLRRDVFWSWKDAVPYGSTLRRAKPPAPRTRQIVVGTNRKRLAASLTVHRDAAYAGRRIPAFRRAEAAGCRSFAKDGSAQLARRIAVFGISRHKKRIPNPAFDDKIIAGTAAALNQEQPQQ